MIIYSQHEFNCKIKIVTLFMDFHFCMHVYALNYVLSLCVCGLINVFLTDKADKASLKFWDTYKKRS